MRTVLITGGSRGIGAACVRAFCANGDRVFFFYRSEHGKAEELARQTGAVAIACDVTDCACVERAFSSLPAIDVLVCNAGISACGLFQDVTEEEWSRMIGTHLDGAYRCIRRVLPDMIAKKEGSIVTVSSMWGQVGASCEVAYSAAKAGLIGLTKALAKEVGPSGIRVNCVAPGVVDTDMNRNHSPETMSQLAEEIPLGRIGTPEEIARCITWLASPDASYVTGQTLAPNGGMIT